MEWLGEFIAKWWIELVLGGIATGLGFALRHYFKLAKENKAHDDEVKKQAFKEELTGEVKTLVGEVRIQLHNEVVQESKNFKELLYKEIAKESKQVRDEVALYETNDGERLESLETRTTVLENTLDAVAEALDKIKNGLLAVQGHEFRNKCRKLLQQDTITPDEFEQLEADHEAYNGLGGNHKGDSLFEQVKVKYYG